MYSSTKKKPTLLSQARLACMKFQDLSLFELHHRTVYGVRSIMA